MKRAMWALAIGAAVAGAASLPATGQPDDRAGPENLFISPCGQPFRAKPGEPYPVIAWFNQTDQNKDGVIDLAEFRAEATAFFQVLDQNHDGVISPPEVSYYEHVLAPEVGVAQYGAAAPVARLFLAQAAPGEMDIDPESDVQSDLPHKSPYHVETVGAVAYELLAEPEPVSGSDLNLNGRITLAEFLQATDRRFHKLDAKGDGKLTLAELPKTLVQRMLERSSAAPAKRGRSSS